MKKFLITMLFVLVLSGSVFASSDVDKSSDVEELAAKLAAIEAQLNNTVTKESGISISGWGRAVFAPGIHSDNGDMVPIQGTSWGGNKARIGLTIKGENESGNMGFHVDMNHDGGESGHQDQQKIWAKPFPNLTVEVGPSVFYGALRGDAAYGAWNWLRFADQDDEDAIFVRGKAGGGDQNNLHQNGNGIQGGWDREDGVYAGSIIHYDKDQVHVFAALDQSHGSLYKDENGDVITDSAGNGIREDYTTSDMFQRGQYGFGYEISDFGMFRVQYIGKAYLEDASDDELENYGVFNAALKLDNLADDFTLDVGYFHPTEEFGVTGDSKHGYKQLNAYAKYTAIDSWTLHSTLQTKFDKADVDGDEGLGFHLGVGADHDFNVIKGVMAGSYTVNTDLRYFNDNWTTNDNSVGALVGISKNLENGKIGIGLEYTSTKFVGTDADTDDTDEGNWTIPVVLEYWF